MTKGLISIFAMPQEIDDLQITLFNLKRNMAMLPHDIDMDIDITFCMSDALTDWEMSKIPFDYFVDKFNSMKPLLDWSKEPRIHIEFVTTVLGCVSQRRRSLQLLDKYDFTIWLDCDMMFNDNTILYLASAYRAVKDNGHDNFIISPQFVRQWDNSWDELVHNDYKNHELMYHEKADIIADSLYDYGDINVVPISDFKFAGGWCTLISNDLLRITGIPESFGHYGLEDTYVAAACDLMAKANHPAKPKRFLLQNLIVGENYKYRHNGYLKQNLYIHSRKNEFREIAVSHFNEELHNFRKRVIDNG